MLLLQKLLYDLSIRCYYAAIRVASVFQPKAAEWIRGRNTLWDDLKNAFKEGSGGKIIWFHFASLGEFEQGRPVLESLRKKYPHHKVLITFFSPSGFNVKKNYENADHVSFLPLDTAGNARKFLDIIRPDLVFFTKYEFWYHYLIELKKRNIPTILISALFRPDQPFFKWYGKIFRNLLDSFNILFVQDEGSVKLLNKIKVSGDVIHMTDTRFDRVYELSRHPEKNEKVEEFAKGHLTIIAGSTHLKEEEMLVEWINTTDRKDIKVIIAPHEIHKKTIEKLEKRITGKTTLFSLSDFPEDAGTLIIDKVGLLASMYQYADIAVIGGGFDAGIHNILEPASFGLPVLFGPKYHKFREATDLLNKKAAVTFSNYESFVKALTGLIGNNELRKKKGEICSHYISEHTGSTEKILSKVDKWL